MHMLYITAKDKAQALTIGKALVERRLAACVNVIDGMTSIYPWQGRLETSDEAILIAKTDERRVDDVVAAVRELHSYDVPCVLAVPVLGGNTDYIDWLRDQLR